ncbi:hypothetical protein OK016_04250 [Vibrio chagasii]|nr:hypothetical protein [Vibrio chagasii]
MATSGMPAPIRAAINDGFVSFQNLAGATAAATSPLFRRLFGFKFTLGISMLAAITDRAIVLLGFALSFSVHVT